MSSESEAGRLAALHDLKVLDTPPEAIFDSLTRLAAMTFQTPIALVSLVDADRQWFKSCVGLDTRETSRDVAFCDYAIRQSDVMVVPDATRDPRFADNPLVTGDLGIRFYAGAPLITPSGHRLGTLCIIDVHPRPGFDQAQCAQLETMASAVTDALAMRRDIADSMALERQRAKDRALLAQAEEMAGVGYWSWDTATDVTFWSPEVYRIHGYDPGLPPPDLAGVLALYHPDDATVLAGLVARAVSHGEPYSLKARVIRPDGETRHVSARGSCEQDATGAVTALVGTFIDVTDLKLADENLRVNEARLQSMMDNSNDLVFRLEPGRGITWVSPCCRQYGYEPEELLGAGGTDLIHPEDRANFEAVRAARFAGLPDPPGSTRHHRVRLKDGSWLYVEGSPTLIRGADGQVLEVVNILRNVTAQRETVQALEDARAAAEVASRIKTDFLANMSHEIRTPLTAILGYTSLLANEAALDDASRAHVSRVTSAGHALLAIVNDVLDFSKLEAGQVVISPKPTRVDDLLQDTLLMFAPEADIKGITLEFEIVDELPAALMVDPDKIRQILLNLIGNAVKFTDRGRVRLKTRHDPIGNQLDIWVEDTGPGMAEDQCAKLFQRFSQVDGSSTRRHGGTGLGLAISHSLAQAMGGDIDVESRIGRGSVFHLQIEAAVTDPSPDLDAAGLEDGDLLGGIRILVIDDNPTNLELARSILEMFGAITIEAGSGQEGLDLAGEIQVDAIMLDMRMPGMDGPEVLARLRATPGPNREAPVLAFTAASEPLSTYLENGFDGLITKPIMPAITVDTLVTAIREKRQGPDPIQGA